MAKRKFELSNQNNQPFSADVQFPLYRKHDLGGEDRSTVVYTQINDDLTAVHIVEETDHSDQSRKYGVEWEQQYQFDTAEADSHVGRGRYQCSKDEFKAARQRMEATVGNWIQGAAKILR
jgi:hypothetical protein